MTGSTTVTAVVSAFLCRGDKILLLKRSAHVASYQGCWATVSGYLEEETPLLQALKEIREETGLPQEALRLLSWGERLVVSDAALDKIWHVYPFRFEVVDARCQIILDREHEAMRWVAVEHLGDYQTVPLLREAYQRSGDEIAGELSSPH